MLLSTSAILKCKSQDMNESIIMQLYLLSNRVSSMHSINHLVLQEGETAASWRDWRLTWFHEAGRGGQGGLKSYRRAWSDKEPLDSVVWIQSHKRYPATENDITSAAAWSVISR
jgi:hypothetical protein